MSEKQHDFKLNSVEELNNYVDELVHDADEIKNVLEAKLILQQFQDLTNAIDEFAKKHPDDPEIMRECTKNARVIYVLSVSIGKSIMDTLGLKDEKIDQQYNKILQMLGGKPGFDINLAADDRDLL